MQRGRPCLISVRKSVLCAKNIVILCRWRRGGLGRQDARRQHCASVFKANICGFSFFLRQTRAARLAKAEMEGQSASFVEVR